MKLNLRSHNINSIVIISCILAISLQIQVTLFSARDYGGLRINLADLFLPFLGLYVATSLLLKKSNWPKWKENKYIYFSLLALFTVMSISLIHGYLSNGFMSQWALINKYIGFVILVSYTLLGGWLATNTNNKKLILYFLRIFCGFFIITVVLSLLALIIWHSFNIPLWIGNYEWDGLMANRNAYMLLALFTLATISVYQCSSQILFPPWVYSLFWILMPFFVIFNSSRTFWITGGIIILYISVRHPLHFVRKTLPFLVIGSVFCAGLITIVDSQKTHNFQQIIYMKNLVVSKEVTYSGDQMRFIAVEDGLELYKKSNPILGAGLGSYQEFQTEKRGEFINIIDFTALWLLVETGALGLFTFTSFFSLCLWILYKHSLTPNNLAPFYSACFLFLLAFAGASLLHEITYTRFVWLILGLGLAKLPDLKRNICSSHSQ